MLKSPILSHPIQTQTKFKASLSQIKTHGLLKAPLSSDQDPIITFMAMVFRSRLFLSQALFSHKPSTLSLSLSLSLDWSKPSATVVWCLDLKTINQTQKGSTAVRGCGGQRWRIKAWGASAWVPHGETKVEDRMVVIGLKIGEGLKLVDVDVVGLKILDHWFEFSFGSLGFKSRIVVILCLDC